MRLLDGTDIDPRGYRSAKFGNDPMTEYVWNLGLNGIHDEDTGESDSPTGFVGRVGRHLVCEDSVGFVSRVKFPTVADAQAAFAAVDAEYSAWAEDGTDNDDEVELIDDAEARRIASEWHGGMGSALYALSSTGTITSRTASEVHAELSANLGSSRDLVKLSGYIGHHGERGPVNGWSDLLW